MPRLAANDALDNATLKFLVARALLDRREQEEERRKREEEKAKEAKESMQQFLDQLGAKAWRELEERLDSGGASSKRKRKKRRKRRTPRTSSLPSRPRRRQRQWSACSAGFTGDDIPRVMFPSVDARPNGLFWENTSGYAVFASWLNSGYMSTSVYVVVVFAGGVAPHAVFPCVVPMKGKHNLQYHEYGVVVSNGKYSWTCLSTAPVAEPTVMSDRPDSHAHRFADRGADRRHSSPSWSCSWFPPRTEFYIVSSGIR